MAHNTLKTSYSNLSERLNRFPQGAPPSKLLYEILKILFSEKEAALVSLLPIKPFTAEKAKRIWKMEWLVVNFSRRLFHSLSFKTIPLIL